jgi:hypothetical protein
MKVLSIDWDYFFPDTSFYDWGANEENPIFLEQIWGLRCEHRNMKTKKSVLTEMKPSVPKDFWNIVKNRPQLYVAESHVQMWKILREKCPVGVDVVNIDAHHDCGYYEKDQIDCGNWGFYACDDGIARQVTVHYPSWRLGQSEGYHLVKFRAFYKLPAPANYCAVFICRSGCWTPPWHDHTFRKLVKDYGRDPVLLDTVCMKTRHPANMKEARECRDRLRGQMKLLEAK